MAPSRFTAIAPPMETPVSRKRANRIPEKKMGRLSSATAASLPVMVGANPPARETYQPSPRLASSSRKGRTTPRRRHRLTAIVARKAMARMPAIEIPITCQVLPNVRPSSVMALVSTSMNPAPRKKKTAWLKSGRSRVKLRVRSAVSRTTTTPMKRYERGYTRAAM
jgi:hypothetical protein